MGNDVSLKLLHGIHDSTDHGVCNIFMYMYNIVSHYFQFPFCLQDIIHFVHLLRPVDINFHTQD